MAKIVSVVGSSVKNCLPVARRALGVPLNGNRAAIISGGEDSCYRVTLEGGDIVECTIMQRALSVVEDIRDE